MTRKTLQISVQGFGVFYVSPEWAESIASIAKQAEASTPPLDLVVPVHLTDVGDRLIHTIKNVRTVTGLSLVEAKRAVDSVEAGSSRFLLGRFVLPEAVRIRDLFAEGGAKAEVADPLTLLALQAE